MERSNLPHWDSIARDWRVSPPLSPDAADVAWLEQRALVHTATRTPPVALLLGLTPAIRAMHWPAAAQPVAVDWSREMIRNLVGNGRGGVICGDWRELPLAPHTCGLALGDGSYTALGSRRGGRLLNDELARVLRPGSHVLMRCFARPDPPLSFDALLQRAGRIEHEGLLRFLVAMALQDDLGDGVMLDAVWRAGQMHVHDRAEAFARWEGNPARYWFPSPRELRELVSARFELLEYDVPAMEWGECFPRLALRLPA